MNPAKEDSILAPGTFRKSRVLRREDVRAAVDNSKSIYDACMLLAAHNSSVYKAMRKFEIPKPKIWEEGHRFKIGRLRKLGISTIIESEPVKAYVGIILGTEGGMTLGYQSHRAITELRLIVSMTDRPWVAKFSELCGLGPPRHIPPSKPGYKEVWQKTIKGLRALIVLRDVLPYLMGEKLREAQAALDFFSPTGYRKGRFRPADVWTPVSFPYRYKESR
ncbi:MAG: hypothetical protein OK442_01435 [Thaumarchaeota archaeon]|nr:hypothetical protein [Nitrososphaerota archaeon]